MLDPLVPRWRPILFSAPMVRAILADTKTVTRRIVTPQPTWDNDGGQHGRGAYTWPSRACRSMVELRDMGGLSPYGARGDRLWVRETWCLASHENFCVGVPPELEDGRPRGPVYEDSDTRSFAFYRATDGDSIVLDSDGERSPWKPAIHMPRWASRISLEVVSVRVEHLLDITDDDARREGVEPIFTRFPNMGRDQRITDGVNARDEEYRASFAVLWDEINGDRALWNTNPFVWRVEFRRIDARSTAVAA